MYHSPLVSAETLAKHLDDSRWVIFDVRHDLMNPAAGLDAFGKGHIPGAVHAHIDTDLSSSVGDGKAGRHPLPDAEAFQEFMQRCGANEDSQIVAYDDAGGMWAGRVWWLCRYFGHANVAVLDGGWQRWNKLEMPTTQDVASSRPKGNFTAVAGNLPITDEAAIEAGAAGQLVDARAAPRYRGDEEPIDPAAGHIPGAVNLPFGDNLAEDDRFLSPDELRARFEAVGDAITVYCGSGVSAAHNALAMDVAGLPIPTLYPGSWSAWSTQGRAVATGPK